MLKKNFLMLNLEYIKLLSHLEMIILIKAQNYNGQQAMS